MGDGRSCLAMAVVSTSRLALANGSIPLVGYGCWKVDRANAADLVEKAIRMGYRHIDGACDYGNEKEVGLGIRRAIEGGVCKRGSSLSPQSCVTLSTPQSMWRQPAGGALMILASNTLTSISSLSHQPCFCTLLRAVPSRMGGTWSKWDEVCQGAGE